jgi:ATP-dependent exoDNAse (exonuclease V) beta subunit
MDDMEKLRLLYVAATRARDHLVVSLHRSAMSNAKTAAKAIADAGGTSAAQAVPFAGYAVQAERVPVATAAPPPPYDEWFSIVEIARAATRVSPAVSASGLEGTEPDVALDPSSDPGLAKGPRDLELPPWSKGRYGSAIGRAVHAVLQAVDVATGDGLDQAVTAQAMAEGVLGHEELIRQLADSALASDVVQRAAAREHWRETYVGTVRADGVVLEGYIDLVYREDDGSLAIVDYKTDAVPVGAIPSRVTYYKPQMDAYREALTAATGARVTTTLLFLHPAGALAERL